MVWNKDLPLGTKPASTFDDDCRANFAALETWSGVEHIDLTNLASAGGGRHNLPYGDETARDAIVAAGTATTGMQFWRNDTTPKRAERWNGSSWDIITNSTDVSASTNALSWKEPVRVAATANLAALSGLLTLDTTVTLNADDRVLVPFQIAEQDNGIYVAAAGAWSRAADFDTTSGAKGMTVVPVQEGTLYNDTLWKLTTDKPITVGTTSLSWALVNRLVFTSSNQTITNATLVTVAHGLGAIPTKLQVHIVCTTGELGYSVDDIVLHGSFYNNSGTERGMALIADATNCHLMFAQDGVGIVKRNTPQLGSVEGLTNSSWVAVITAEL